VGAIKLQYSSKANLRVVYKATQNGTVVEQTNYDPCSVRLVFYEFTKSNTIDELIPIFYREGRVRDANTWQLSINNYPLSIIPRGYTGHEHLPHFALINMNGRMYSLSRTRFGNPVLGRMLSPDNYVQNPSNAQNYNRYAYVLNNPLKYTDPSGELWGFDDLIVGAIGFAVGYISSGIQTGDWGKQSLLQGLYGAGMALLMYNLSSAAAFNMNSMALGFGARYAATAAVSSLMPSYNVQITDNLSFSLSPSIIFGSSQNGFGLSANFNLKMNDYFLSFGGSFMSYGNNFGGENFETRRYWAFGYDNGKNRIWYSSSYYQSGKTSQNLGAIGYYNYKHKFSFIYQNDYMYGLPADGGDRYRTAAAQLGIGDFSVGVNLFTGDPGLDKNDRYSELGSGKYHNNKQIYTSGTPNEFRAGIGYIGYQNYRIGRNSEIIRHIAQDKIAHDGLTGFFGLGKNPSPHFLVMPIAPSNYFYFGSKNPYTLW